MEIILHFWIKFYIFYAAAAAVDTFKAPFLQYDKERGL